MAEIQTLAVSAVTVSIVTSVGLVVYIIHRLFTKKREKNRIL